MEKVQTGSSKYLKLFHLIDYLNFRKATIDDANILFEWVNQRSVRAQSFSPKEIEYTDHIQWLSKKLDDTSCFLYIAYPDTEPAGIIRFDKDNNIYIISYLISEEKQGKGFGNMIIKEGINQFLKDSSYTGTITALVKKSNVASIKIFSKNNFQQEEVTVDTIRFSKSFL